MPDDPRLGKPSASSFGLDALCPGRQALLQTLGDIPEPIDPDAQRGVKLHLAWQKEDSTGLDAEDAELYERGLKLVKEAYNQWFAILPSPDVSATEEGAREQRFYLHDEQGILAASGQADRHYIACRYGLILDFKSLYNHSLTPSELNWQLLLLAVLIAREYELTHVRCAFVKPMFNR